MIGKVVQLTVMQHHYFQYVFNQWFVTNTGTMKKFPITYDKYCYSIIACKKDTSANSVPDVRNYTKSGFDSYGPSPMAYISTGV